MLVNLNTLPWTRVPVWFDGRIRISHPKIVVRRARFGKDGGPVIDHLCDTLHQPGETTKGEERILLFMK